MCLNTPQYFAELFAVWTDRLVAAAIAVTTEKKGSFTWWVDPGWMLNSPPQPDRREKIEQRAFGSR